MPSRNRVTFRALYVSETTTEANMPIVLLWVGIPVILLGGGYFIVHAMH
jgi:hypothetical protein